MNILVTGGAGFIGSHVVDALVENGHRVRVLDNLSPQVHADPVAVRESMSRICDFVYGDVADKAVLESTLDGQDAVIHLAAETGTGQSMYEVVQYERTNVRGSALLAGYLATRHGNGVQRVVVASSRAVYGEGKYQCSEHGVFFPEGRATADLAAGQFDPLCPECHRPMVAVPTPETAPALPESFYGATKFMQERTALMFGRALDVPTYALRFQNVYGPGQSLSNPYTGILAIFAGLARTGRDINVFEDGMESRDFVFIDDAVNAIMKCLDAPPQLASCVLNVGSGIATSVIEVATRINEYFGGRSRVVVSGSYRKGDVRHALADTALCERILHFNVNYGFRNGLRKFLDWAHEKRETTAKSYEGSLNEMAAAGLFVRRESSKR